MQIKADFCFKKIRVRLPGVISVSASPGNLRQQAASAVKFRWGISAVSPKLKPQLFFLEFLLK
jgi:hypothetical protein